MSRLEVASDKSDFFISQSSGYSAAIFQARNIPAEIGLNPALFAISN
jgi:hypothetical protein